MPIPDLLPNGLLPTGEHECFLAEVEAVFVYNSERSPERELLWKDLLKYLDEIREFKQIKEVYIDGSFTTNRQIPDDIDILLEFQSITNWRLLQTNYPDLFKPARIRERYRIDMLPHAYNLVDGEFDALGLFKQLDPEDAIRLNLAPDTPKGILLVRWPFQI